MPVVFTLPAFFFYFFLFRTLSSTITNSFLRLVNWELTWEVAFFWPAQAIRRAVQHNLPQHNQSAAAATTCVATRTALPISEEVVAVETRAVDLLHAALIDLDLSRLITR